MAFSAVQSRKKPVLIAEQIVEALQSGTLRAGDRLPSERTLAETFGVSRPSLREALCALEIAGLIEVRTGEGIFIKGGFPNPFSQAILLLEEGTPLEIVEAREVIESNVAALAATNRNQDDLDSMARHLKAMQEEIERGQYPAESDYRFHLAIAAATGNAVLSRQGQSIFDLMRHKLYQVLRDRKLESEEGERSYLMDHRRIYEAVLAKDAEGAREAMQGHLSNVEKRLLKE